MTIWTLNTPPSYAPHATANQKGWVDDDTGEVYVAIKGLATKGAAANITKIEFVAEEYEHGDALSVKVFFSEKVDVTAGASIVVSSTGATATITLYALAQTNTNEILFNKAVNLTSAVVVPDEYAELSVGSQTVTATVYDDESAVKASGVLTGTANFANNETVTIGEKVYTFKTTLTNTDGFVKVGETLELSLANLCNAILAAPVELAAIDFAAATVAHTLVTATADATTLTVTAKTAGTDGNSIASTTTASNATWGNTTLESGTVGVASTKTVSAAIGTAAGTREIPVAVVSAVEFDDSTLAEGDALSVTVTFSGYTVDVTAGASIVATTSGSAANVTLYALEQSDVDEVVFNKAANGTDSVLVPSEAGTLSIAAQTIGGTVVDHGTSAASNLAISSTVAAACATVVVPEHALISSIAFDEAAYVDGDELSVTVTYDDAVDVTAGATIVVTSTGSSGNITLYAGAQSNVTDVVFDQDDAGDPVVIPGEPATLSVGAQTLSGTIVDHGSTVASDKGISAGEGTAAGTRVITFSDISNVQFDDNTLTTGDPLSVTVTYDEAVDVTAGASIVILTSGVAGDISLYAAAQSNVTAVVFDKKVDNTTPETVPADAGTLSIGAQTLGGTIKPNGELTAADKAITSALGTGAGTVVVS